MRILVVDDDKTMCEEFTDLLKEDGHKVSAAYNGLKALDAMSETSFEVVFTDLKMPRMNGLDLLREIRRLYPSVYVVMITGYATVETAVEALKLGAFDYVQKPFRIEQVRAILKRLDEERRFREPWTAWSPDPQTALLKATKSGAEPIAFVWGTSTIKAAHLVRFDPGSPGPGTVSPRDLHRVKEIAGMHCSQVAKPAVLIERVDRLAEGHDWADVFDVLSEVRKACGERGGTLLLTLDPAKLTQSQVSDLRRLAGEPFVAEMVDTLASPIRRAVLTHLEAGPSSFSDIMRHTEVDDSPKLTFHLKKMVASGFLMHEAQRYGLADKGKRASKFLSEMETEGSLKLAGSGMLFEVR